jgi:hypothetical protein
MIMMMIVHVIIILYVRAYLSLVVSYKESANTQQYVYICVQIK